MSRLPSKPGYILPLTLMVIALAVITTTYLFEVVVSYSALAHTVQEREQAKTLALGGVQLAIAQLSNEPRAATSTGRQEVKKDPDRQLLERILPYLNRWQTFTLHEQTDHAEGTLRICISCEQGKINLAALQALIQAGTLNDTQKQLAEALLSKVIPASGSQQTNIFNALYDFLKKRAAPLYDVTQLHDIPALASLPFFYQPPEQEQSTKERGYYLLDIFTLESTSAQVEPWLLSDSLCGLLGLKRAQAGDIKEREQEVKQWLEKFSATVQWQQQWNTLLKPLYGKEFGSLPKGIELLLAPKFEPRVFSVISYGQVGTTVQRLYAIVMRMDGASDRKGYALKKLYWI